MASKLTGVARSKFKCKYTVWQGCNLSLSWNLTCSLHNLQQQVASCRLGSSSKPPPFLSFRASVPRLVDFLFLDWLFFSRRHRVSNVLRLSSSLKAYVLSSENTLSRIASCAKRSCLALASSIFWEDSVCVSSGIIASCAKRSCLALASSPSVSRYLTFSLDRRLLLNGAENIPKSLFLQPW